MFIVYSLLFDDWSCYINNVIPAPVVNEAPRQAQQVILIN